MSRELILEWAIFILIGHPPPSCLFSRGLMLILTVFSSSLKARYYQRHWAHCNPSLPVTLLSPFPSNLQTLLQKAVVVKVLLQQVWVIFQTWCRFVCELDWSLSPAFCCRSVMNGTARLADTAQQMMHRALLIFQHALSSIKAPLRLLIHSVNTLCFFCIKSASKHFMLFAFFCIITPLVHED